LPLPPRKVADKTSQSTKDRGQVNGKDPTAEQSAAVKKSGAASFYDAAKKRLGG
jgi:hypothetical protein